jgi:hypothetical protein
MALVSKAGFVKERAGGCKGERPGEERGKRGDVDRHGDPVEMGNLRRKGN